MKRTIIYLLVIAFLFWYFIFNPKRSNKEKSEVSTETISTLEEDSIMQNSMHLKFKNVPIDGTLEKFVKRMVRSGFKKEDIEEGRAVLSGDFAGYKQCIIHIETLDHNDLVSRITVCFPQKDKWAHLYDDYKSLKEMLTIKYGKPKSCVEKFQGPSYAQPDDDNMRMHYVENDKCKYVTFFVTDKGEITLWIANESNSSTYVALQYKDKINSSTIKQHALEDL